ncbi:hypothetical protein JCM10908_004112 [Rhodotorula pacifica]|uniref:uncharacterized protein n=1 Tax=Rhodotorula pacifica TaxID=1495444 RepID=UPI003180E60D
MDADSDNAATTTTHRASDPSLSPPPPSADSPSPISQDALPPMPPQALPPTPDLQAFLRGALPPPPPMHGAPVVRSARPSSEKTDERCWTFTSQSNARRALGREPQTTMYCYLNLRNVIADLVAVPGAPNAFLARDAPPGSPSAAEVERKLKERSMRKVVTTAASEGETPTYHWPWLDGRYLYIATGRNNIARHLNEMGGAAVDQAEEKAPANGGAGAAAAVASTGTAREPVHPITTTSPPSSPPGRPRRRSLPPTLDEGHLGAWDMLKRIEDRVEKAEAERLQPGKREEEMMRRALGFEPKDSERLISLSDAYSSGLQRLHAHFVRIYSPGLRNLARLPETFTDGTQKQMLETVTGRLTDGSAFGLVGRLWESLGNVHTQLEERRKRRGEGGGGAGEGFAGGFGGAQPPLPPSMPPPPPPPVFPPVEGV